MKKELKKLKEKIYNDFGFNALYRAFGVGRFNNAHLAEKFNHYTRKREAGLGALEIHALTFG